MADPKDIVEHLTAALRSYGFEESRAREMRNPLAKLLSITSQLPCSNMNMWERLIRAEIAASRREAANTDRGYATSKLHRQPECRGSAFNGLASARFPWIDLCHGCGRVRERALEDIHGPAPDAFFFAVALRRLNDWVPEVRATACSRLPALAARSNPEHVVDALWALLPDYGSWLKAESGAGNGILGVIEAAEVPRMLVDRITTAQTGRTPRILAQAGRSATIDGELRTIARQARQPATRACAYGLLLEGRMKWDVGHSWVRIDRYAGTCARRLVYRERPLTVSVPFLEVLNEAAVDRSALVRRLAGVILVRNLDVLGAQLAEPARRLAADPREYVAIHGRFAVNHLEGCP